MKSVRDIDIASSYGSADRPLRRYIALSEALERALGDLTGAQNEGQALHLSLVRTWGYYLMRALDLRNVHVLCIGRNCEIPICYGQRDEQIAAEVTGFAAQDQDTAFKEAGEVFLFQVQMVPFRLVGALRCPRAWAIEDIGWATDSLDLLRRVSQRARRRELDKIAHSITRRQTTRKELKPSNLYYNLLDALKHVAWHNHSSLVLTCAEDEAVIAAEIIRYPIPCGSTRIGKRLGLPTEILQSLDECSVVHADGRTTEAGVSLCAELYGSDWGTHVQSVLLVLLETQQPLQRRIAALADSHSRFFSSADLDAVRYIAKRSAPIISNTVDFAQRLERTSDELDNVIHRSRSQSELLKGISNWMKETFESYSVRILLDAGEEIPTPASIADPGIPTDYLARLIKGNRPLYTRVPSALDTSPQQAFAAFFGVPLHLLDEKTGAVVCQYWTPRQASPFEHYLLEAAGKRIAAALTIWELGDQQLAKLHQALKLMEVVAAASDADKRLLIVLTSEVKKFLGADYCFVSTPDDAGFLHLQAKSWSAEFGVPPIAMTGERGAGITGLVAYRQTIYRTGDVTTDPYYRDVVGAETPIPIRSEMAGPLIFEGRLLGIIDLMSSRLSAFSEQDQTLLQMLLAHSSVALAHAQRASKDRDHKLLTDRLHPRLLKLKTPDDIYAMLLDTAIACVEGLHPGHAIYGNLYVKQPGVRFLAVKAFVGRKSATFSPTLYFNEGVVGTVASRCEPMVIADTTAPPQGINFAPFIEEITQGSEIAVPTAIGGEVDAVINLESPTPSLFGPNDLAALTALADEISLAVRFAQLNESVLIDKRRRERDREMKFLVNLSHEVAKSARITHTLAPQLEELMADQPKALKVLALIRGPAKTAMELQDQLVASLANPGSDHAASDVIAEVRYAMQITQNAHPDVRVVGQVTPKAFEVPCSIDSLRFIFCILFDNAIEAMDGIGTLTIREHSCLAQDTLVIDVTDTGRGISTDKHSEIWDPYFSDDGTGKRKGSGVGLWLVKDNMERMNGYVALHRSVPGKGTTFRLTFTANSHA